MNRNEFSVKRNEGDSRILAPNTTCSCLTCGVCLNDEAEYVLTVSRFHSGVKEHGEGIAFYYNCVRHGVEIARKSGVTLTGWTPTLFECVEA